jgi:hypothetical protein
MRRREFVTLVSGAAATWPLVAHAQPTGKRPTIGFVNRWSGVQISHPAPKRPNKQGLLAICSSRPQRSFRKKNGCRCHNKCHSQHARSAGAVRQSFGACVPLDYHLTEPVSFRVGMKSIRHSQERSASQIQAGAVAGRLFALGIVLALALTAIQLDVSRACRGAFSRGFSSGFDVYRCELVVRKIGTNTQFRIPLP